MWPFDHLLRPVFADAQVSWRKIRRYRSALLESSYYVSEPDVSFCLILGLDDSKALEVLETNLDALHLDSSTTEFVVFIPESFGDEWKGISFHAPFLKIYTYEPETHRGKLRNQAMHVCRGKILFSLAWGDLLPPRATRFVRDEMTKSRFESMYVFEKKWRNTHRMAIWRDTFYELGGFDDRLAFDTQCDDLVSRAKKYGVMIETATHDNYTQSNGPKRSFLFWRRNARQVRVNFQLSTELIKPLQ